MSEHLGTVSWYPDSAKIGALGSMGSTRLEVPRDGWLVEGKRVPALEGRTVTPTELVSLRGGAAVVPHANDPARGHAWFPWAELIGLRVVRRSACQRLSAPLRILLIPVWLGLSWLAEDWVGPWWWDNTPLLSSTCRRGASGFGVGIRPRT